MSKDPDSSLNPLSQPKRGAPFGPTGQHLPQRPAFDRGTEGAVGARLGPGGPESSKSGAAAALDSCSSACLESKIRLPSYSIALAPCQFCLEAVRKHRRTPIRPLRCDSMVRYGTSPGEHIRARAANRRQVGCRRSSMLGAQGAKPCPPAWTTSCCTSSDARSGFVCAELAQDATGNCRLTTAARERRERANDTRQLAHGARA